MSHQSNGMPPASSRAWRVVALSAEGTVVTQDAKRGRVDTGETPSEWGLWGLYPGERAIIRSGLTAAGHDRKSGGHKKT